METRFFCLPPGKRDVVRLCVCGCCVYCVVSCMLLFVCFVCLLFVVWILQLGCVLRCVLLPRWDLLVCGLSLLLFACGFVVGVLYRLVCFLCLFLLGMLDA